MTHNQSFDTLTFSQRHGHKPIPQPPKLGEISRAARNRLWDTLWTHLDRTANYPGPYAAGAVALLGEPWKSVLSSVHRELMQLSLDQYSGELRRWQTLCKKLLSGQFNRCFDFLEIVMRHRTCPESFISEVQEIFRLHLAYRIDTTGIPTIVPAVTSQEGEALVEAIEKLEHASLGGAATHLRSAAERILQEGWADSVRDSIHAVESVVKNSLGEEEGTLGRLLGTMEREHGLHPALKTAVSALYGYTSAEPGVRHARFDDESRVTQDEALFMLPVCAAFCTYVLRKFSSQDSPSLISSSPQ